ncbi:hypothetical protein M1446_00710 [Candidatus Dependentiae bacterium]|nr:hypothetical protein [Candidatus Dependentiae bacterium]
MATFAKLKDTIINLDKRQFYQYLLIFNLVFLTLIGLLIWRQNSNTNFLLRKLKTINEQRRQVKEILEEYESIQAQKREVDELLAQDKNFKIAQFMANLIRELDLGTNTSKEPEPLEEDLNEDYTEIKLDSSFINLNMQQLCNLLYKIDQNERVYTKELIITKVPKKNVVDVTLVIATLKPKESTL